MSERTLDDLAARLAALGWEVIRVGFQLTAERDVEDGLTHRFVVRDDPASLVGPMVTGFERMVHQGEEVYHIGVELPPETLTALSLIRQWQASAEPAPPPAAPVVTIRCGCGGELEEIRERAQNMHTNNQYSTTKAGDLYCPACHSTYRIRKGELESAAPVMTITPEMVERAALKLNQIYSDYDWTRISGDWKQRTRLKARSVLDAALRGADLAPEGAR